MTIPNNYFLHKEPFFSFSALKYTTNYFIIMLYYLCIWCLYELNIYLNHVYIHRIFYKNVSLDEVYANCDFFYNYIGGIFLIPMH